MREFESILCPICGKLLFKADKSAQGDISAFCKRCKESRVITLKGKEK